VKLRTGTSRRRRAASLDEHRREIPLKVDMWQEQYPKTPAQRLLESPDVSDKNKAAVLQLLKDNDICRLRSKLNVDLKKLAVILVASPAGETPSAHPRQPVGIHYG